MRRLVFGMSLALLIGCGPVKSRTKLSLPPAYSVAREATLEELVRLVNDGYAKAQSLRVSSLKIEFTGGSVDTGYVEEYRSAKGILVAQRPNSIYLNILNPLTSSTVVAMTAVGPSFQIWAPGQNRFLMGKTDVTVKEENPIFHVRPQHLLEGILVEPIPEGSPFYRYFLYETEDPSFRYYVVGIVELEEGSQIAHLVRKLWIERSKLDLVRQFYYQGGGLVSAIDYGDPHRVDDLTVHSRISIDRKRENYRITLVLSRENLRVNVPIKQEAFVLPVPPGAKVTEVTGENGKGQQKTLQ